MATDLNPYPTSLAVLIPGPPPWLHDRRDPESRERLRQRVRAEYREMPGLCLTLMQGIRLFGLRPDICQRVFVELEAEGLLNRVPGCPGVFDEEFALRESAR